MKVRLNCDFLLGKLRMQDQALEQTHNYLIVPPLPSPIPEGERVNFP